MQKAQEYKVFLWILILISLSFLALLMPFWGIIFWAVAITIIFVPVHNWFLKKTSRENLSALLTLFLCSFIVVIPFVMITNSFITQGVEFYNDLQSNKINLQSYFNEINEAFPQIQYFLDKIGVAPDEIRSKLKEAAGIANKFIVQQTVNLGQGTIGIIVQIGILLYITFFILRDNEKLLNCLHLASPLGREKEKRFFNKFSEVTRATIKGSIIVAVVQGTLGGLMFWFLGISAPLLWGVVMTLLSLVPMVGAGLIWLPVAIYLFAIGQTQSGIILIAFGVLIIGLVDNILRPILVGRETKLPDYLVLLSTLGGFILFGMNGFAIGPLIAALFITSWDIFIQEFNHEKEKEGVFENNICNKN